MTESILPFIRLVFDSLLVHASDYNLVPVCSQSLFYLVVSFPSYFEPILEEKSHRCTPEQKQKIQQSFQPVFIEKKESLFTLNRYILMYESYIYNKYYIVRYVVITS